MSEIQKCIILSAPSGAGKTTIARHLLNSDLGLEFSVTACSRDRRSNETEGVDYYFLTPQEFHKRVEKNEFLEWEEVYPDHFYGTLKSEIVRIEANGKRVLFDVDVVGGMNIKKIYRDKALAIFISPPSIDALRERLVKRATDSPEKIRIRLEKAQTEMLRGPEFDVIIVNDHLDDALMQTENLVRNFLNGS